MMSKMLGTSLSIRLASIISAELVVLCFLIQVSIQQDGINQKIYLSKRQPPAAVAESDEPQKTASETERIKYFQPVTSESQFEEDPIKAAASELTRKFFF